MTDPALVQAAFGDVLELDGSASLSPWSQVWSATLLGGAAPVAAIVKRTWRDPAPLEAWQRALVASGIRTVAPLTASVEVEDAGERTRWTAYPRLVGRSWDGGTEDLAAAGALLGRMHRASEGLAIDGFPSFEWGDPSRASVDEDIEGIRAAAAAHWPHADVERWTGQLDRFPALLERVRGAALPLLPVSLDHRAANVLLDDAGALMVDLENAALAPRLHDLAIAALLWPLEHPAAGGSALGEEAWAALRDGYLGEVRLTPQELACWPEVLEYMKLEWGTWHLTEGAEAEPEGNLRYLEDLLTLDEAARFPLA